jgi:hypothetical protein
VTIENVLKTTIATTRKHDMGRMLTSSQSTPKLKYGMNSNELELNLNFGEGITPEGVRRFVAQCLLLCPLV